MAYDYGQKQSIKSGIFMLIGIIIVLISIVLFSGNNSFLKSHINLKAKFADVQGLDVGSVVSLSGINVGNIAEIDFSSEEDAIVVTMKIESRFSNKLTTSAVASVKTQGALGDRYIFIKPGNPEDPKLKEDEYINSDKDGDFFDIISKEGPKLTNIVDVVSELKILLANLNKDQNSAKVMASLLQTSEQGQNFLKEGKLLLSDLRGKDQKELREAIQRLNSILGKIDRGEGSLGALINDPVIHERLTSLLGKPARNSYLKPLIRATIKSND